MSKHITISYHCDLDSNLLKTREYRLATRLSLLIDLLSRIVFPTSTTPITPQDANALMPVVRISDQQLLIVLWSETGHVPEGVDPTIPPNSCPWWAQRTEGRTPFGRSALSSLINWLINCHQVLLRAYCKVLF